jgi:hypothetical protein
MAFVIRGTFAARPIATAPTPLAVIAGLMQRELSIGRIHTRARPMKANVVPLGFICRGGMPIGSLPAPLPALSEVSHWPAGFASRAVDPSRPKRPASAWIHFLSDFRKKHKELPGKEVMTSASKTWKVMTVLQKKPFQDIYDANKKVYDVDKEEYVKSGQKEAWARDPDRPKRPLSAFFRFLDGYRTKHASLKATEAAKLGAAVWKDMKGEQKQPYEKQYKEEKNKYDEAMKLYKASGKEVAWKERTGKTTAGKKKKKGK